MMSFYMFLRENRRKAWKLSVEAWKIFFSHHTIFFQFPLEFPRLYAATHNNKDQNRSSSSSFMLSTPNSISSRCFVVSYNAKEGLNEQCESDWSFFNWIFTWATWKYEVRQWKRRRIKNWWEISLKTSTAKGIKRGKEEEKGSQRSIEIWGVFCNKIWIHKNSFNFYCNNFCLRIPQIIFLHPSFQLPSKYFFCLEFPKETSEGNWWKRIVVDSIE